MSNLQEILRDIVDHTHGLGYLPMIKVITDATVTKLEAVAPDRSVILYAKTHEVVPEFLEFLASLIWRN